MTDETQSLILSQANANKGNCTTSLVNPLSAMRTILEKLIFSKFLIFGIVGLFLLGCSIMCVSGYFFAVGLSTFASKPEYKTIYVLSAILFQLSEASCFSLLASLPSQYKKIKFSLLIGGMIIVAFSIITMIFSQKAISEESLKNATDQDDKSANIQKQIDNIDKTIAAYRQNAEQQSKSIYKESRAAGQESLNISMKLMERRDKLVQEKFNVDKNRQVTNIDVYDKLGRNIGVGKDILDTSIISVRSIMLEFFGVFFLSIASFLIRETYSKQTESIPPVSNIHISDIPESFVGYPIIQKQTDSPVEEKKIIEYTRKQEKSTQQVIPINAGRIIKKPPPNTKYPESDIITMAEKILLLKHHGKIKNIVRDSVIKSLNEHCNIKIGSTTAMRVVKNIKERERFRNKKENDSTNH